jgi:hypothetical protein
MPLSEARLDLTLRLAAGKVAGFDVRSSRLTHAARLLAGRRADQVVAMLSTVFPLCGTAQALAGLAAVEHAAGIAVDPAHGVARRIMLLAETVSEHGTALGRDWPALLGEGPDLGTVRNLRAAAAALKVKLYPSAYWNRPGGGELRPDHAGAADTLAAMRAELAHLLAADPGEVADSPQALTAWTHGHASPASRLLAKLFDEGLAGFGAGRFLPMPPGGPPDAGERLAADADGSYAARPDCSGLVFETGALVRHAGHPVVAALLAEHGDGLAARFAARLVEVMESLREMSALVQTLAPAPAAAMPEVARGDGIGVVEAARGLLVHRVALEDGVVADYRMLAPTEWNFHPEGPMARGMIGVGAGPALVEHGRLLINALDPCVVCTLIAE